MSFSTTRVSVPLTPLVQGSTVIRLWVLENVGISKFVVRVEKTCFEVY